MLELYYWPTPNGKKVTILLEELGAAHRIVPMNIGRGDQFHPDILKFSPNNRMPALVDTAPRGGGEAVRLFESGAIMMYIAEKEGRFFPQETHKKYDVIQWLMWQMSNQGPKMGEQGHFFRASQNAANGDLAYANTRFADDVHRIYGVINLGLTRKTGWRRSEYTIADMIYPWAKARLRKIDLENRTWRWMGDGSAAGGEEGDGGDDGARTCRGCVEALGRREGAAGEIAGQSARDENSGQLELGREEVSTKGRDVQMFSHIMIGSNDIARSKKFYDALLGTLGVGPAVTDPNGRLFYMSPAGVFCVTKPIDGKGATHANGGTIGFACANGEQAAAGTRQASPVAAPGRRPAGGARRRHGRMYLAYLKDPTADLAASDVTRSRRRRRS